MQWQWGRTGVGEGEGRGWGGGGLRIRANASILLCCQRASAASIFINSEVLKTKKVDDVVSVSGVG